MSSLICAVTGANAGIGEATARALAGQGAQMVLLCRSEARGEQARDHILQAHPGAPVPQVIRTDLASQASIRSAAEEVCRRFERLDVLINNAGVIPEARQETEEVIELNFGVNYLGHFLLTRLLLDRLRQSAPARIVNLAGMYYKRGRLELDDWNYTRRPYDRWASSYDAQQARVLFTAELARRLQGSGVTVSAVHPGAVLTRAQESMPWWGKLLLYTVLRPAFVRPDRGAQPVVRLATDPAVADISGAFFHKLRQQPLAPNAADAALAARLWTLSEELTGLDPL